MSALDQLGISLAGALNDGKSALDNFGKDNFLDTAQVLKLLLLQI